MFSTKISLPATDGNPIVVNLNDLLKRTKKIKNPTQYINDKIAELESGDERAILPILDVLLLQLVEPRLDKKTFEESFSTVQAILDNTNGDGHLDYALKMLAGIEVGNVGKVGHRSHDIRVDTKGVTDVLAGFIKKLEAEIEEESKSQSGLQKMGR